MVEYVYIIKITVCTNAYLILFPVPFFIFYCFNLIIYIFYQWDYFYCIFIVFL